MTILYSSSSHLSGRSSGFYLRTDANAPNDSFPVTDMDHVTAINLTAGSTYDFTPPKKGQTYGTLVTTAPSDEFALNQAKDVKRNEMQSAYQNAITTSVTFKNSAGITQTYQSDEQSVYNLQSLLTALASDPTILPEDFYWVAEDNTHVIFTYTDMQGLAKVMAAQGIEAFARLQLRKQSINSALTVGDVIVIVW